MSPGLGRDRRMDVVEAAVEAVVAVVAGVEAEEAVGTTHHLEAGTGDRQDHQAAAAVVILRWEWGWAVHLHLDQDQALAHRALDPSAGSPNLD